MLDNQRVSPVPPFIDSLFLTVTIRSNFFFPSDFFLVSPPLSVKMY